MISILERISFAAVMVRGIFIARLVLVFHNRGQKLVAVTCTIIAIGLCCDAYLLITTSEQIYSY